MPDMQTELNKILNEWDKPIEEINQPEKQMETSQAPTEGKHFFRTTNNVTRATFNVVRDNAGITRKEAITLLDKQGYGPSSTASILSQMIKQRLLRIENDGKLYANFAEYVPLKAKLRKIIAKENPRKQRVVKEAKPKPAPQPTVRTEAAPQPQAKQDKQERRIIDIEEWLNEVPLMQARMVYMRLKYIFEGDAA